MDDIAASLDESSPLLVHHFLEETVIDSTEQPKNAEIETGKGILLDENDIFQCGKCRTQLYSLQQFMVHKQNNCKAIENNVEVENLQIEAHSINVQETDIENLVNVECPIKETSSLLKENNCTPIIVKAEDILNLNLDGSQVYSLDGILHVAGLDDQDANPSNVANLARPLQDKSEYIEDHSDLDLSNQIAVASILPENECSDLQDSAFYELFHGSMARSNSKGTKRKGKLKCSYCGKEFTKNFDLQQHIRSHTGEKPFQCIVCGRAFTQKSNLKKHVSSHKVWPGNSMTNTLPKNPIKKVVKEDNVSEEVLFDDSYVCFFCKLSFSSHLEFKGHIKLHRDQKVFKCIQPKCEATFQQMATFLDHVKEHQKDNSYRCHTCAKVFKTLEALSAHDLEHSALPNSKKKGNEAYFRCTKCMNKYSSAEALNYHLQTSSHHFPCEHCNKVYACERLLRKHMHIHDTKNFSRCKLCGKEFKSNYSLKVHVLIHTGERPFECDQCSMAFNRKDKLKRHMLVHQKKRLKCPFRNIKGCSKEFRRADKLRSHVISHASPNSKMKRRLRIKETRSTRKKKVDDDNVINSNETYQTPGNSTKEDNENVPVCSIPNMEPTDKSRENTEINLSSVIETSEVSNSVSEIGSKETESFKVQPTIIVKRKINDKTENSPNEELSQNKTAVPVSQDAKKYEIWQIPLSTLYSSEEWHPVISNDFPETSVFIDNNGTLTTTEIGGLSLLVTDASECASVEL